MPDPDVCCQQTSSLDEESNNNSADADKTALENGEKRKDDDGEMMDDGDKRAGEDEAEGASSSSDKENSTAEAAAADSEGEAKADPESSPGLTSSAKSPSSPVTSTPDSSARKRKAAFVDADTNTIITGKQARKEGRSPRRKEGRKRRGVEPWGKFAGSSSRQHSQRRPRPRGVPACLPASSVISGDLWFSLRVRLSSFAPPLLLLRLFFIIR